MRRVQRKKLEKENRRKQKYKSVLILSIILIGISGILVVDHSLRARMMIEQQKIVKYEKIAGDIHRIHLYGKQLYFNEENLREVSGYFKKEMQNWIEKANEHMIKNKKKFIKMLRITTEQFARLFIFQLILQRLK